MHASACILALSLLTLAQSYSCDLSVAVPSLSARTWTKYECTAADVASQVYTYSLTGDASDRLTVYATDGASCSAPSYDASGFEFYDAGSAGTSGGTNAPVSRSSVPCEHGPPCCLFVFCDNTPGFSCGSKALTVQYSAAPPPSPSALPTPSPTRNADPPSVCSRTTAVPQLAVGVGYQAFSCGSPLVVNYQYSMSIDNPRGSYLAAYATMGRFCAMDPRSEEFEYQTLFSPGYLKPTSQVQVSNIPCAGTVTDYLGRYPEGVYDPPCCTVILCSAEQITDCSGMAITQTFVRASNSPTPSPSARPGSSASPSPAPAAAPTSQPQSTCSAVTSVPMPMQTLDYFTWSCSDSNIGGGSVDVTVRNPAGDRLSVFITYGDDCARSPNNGDFRASTIVRDVQTPIISLQDKPCGSPPCCIVVECANVIGFPCSECPIACTAPRAPPPSTH